MINFSTCGKKKNKLNDNNTFERMEANRGSFGSLKI
jgi:hypothetical protein